MSEESIDWDVLNIEGVESVITQAARGISKNERYRHAVEIEDLEQDARILVATKEDLQECAYEAELGLLHHRLVQDLKDKYKYKADHKNNEESYEALLETASVA